ncbi:hypothetical protein FRC14_001944 [Serendipita sp. 396]|nr:hypothetical protein FRC14_001944 [Serendipita sp. 396]
MRNAAFKGRIPCSMVFQGFPSVAPLVLTVIPLLFPMEKLFTLLLNILCLIGVVYSAPIGNSTLGQDVSIDTRAGSCFPALGFRSLNPDKGPPSTPVSNWWCPLESENGFFGFTYA